MATLAIIGRPNVGKSTLFNRLTGTRRALVHDTPGLTRDRIEGKGRLFDLAFDVIDTAGLEIGSEAALASRLIAQTLDAVKHADIGLFLIDARAGVTTLDDQIARMLRTQEKPILLVANKCEGRAAEADAHEAWALGLGEPVLLSAEHGLGLDQLADALQPHVTRAEGADASALEDRDADADTLRLAIIGRPNTGKSSLINRLIRSERLLSGPEPGLTRDAVDISWRWRERTIRLVDTAGLRRKARIEDKVEQLSSSSSIRAIRACHVALLMVDARAALEKQDLTIANLALDEGRGLLVVCNKWDLVEDERETRAEIAHRLRHRLSQVRDLPLVPVSVLTGHGIERLMPTVVDVYERWSKRIPTSRLNRWLEDAVATNPPPMAQNRRIKIRYATQVSTQPPTIALFANKPASHIPESYLRYLNSSLRDAFGLGGVLIRLVVRHGDNPYV